MRLTDSWSGRTPCVIGGLAKKASGAVAKAWQDLQRGSERSDGMAIAFLAWLVLYFCGNKPGPFGCLLGLLVIAVLITGCA
jgi:hypothetical protein